MSEKEVVEAYRKITGERKERAFFMRKSTKNLMDKLTSYMQDAMVHICLAKQFYESPAGYRSMNLMASGGGMSNEDLTNFQLHVKKNYEEWRGVLFQLSPMGLSIAERVCQDEESLESIRKGERMSHGTAEKLLHFALNEYCHIAGWGEQIKKH